MFRSKIVLITLFSCLVFVSGANAQYRWHIIQPDRIDSVYYAFTSISCSGESCSAMGVDWLFGQQNTNIIIHSIDGGQTWSQVEPTLPQMYYTWNSHGSLTLNSVLQIDSLNAIIVGLDDAFIRTTDGWKTWEADTFNFPPVVIFHDTIAIGFSGIDFSDIGEGVLTDGSDDVNFRTVDTGQHWVEEIHCGNMHPYGNGMWREYRAAYNFNDPDTILTTQDNWNTTDTTTFSWNGPFLTGDLAQTDFQFGQGDTLFSLAIRHDSTGLHQIATMVRSTDLGANWIELPVPRTNRITNAIVSPVDGQTIVIAGQDSTNEILLSTDRGITWSDDTVPFENGIPYVYVTAIAVTGSGRVIASILTDSNVELSSALAYLEPVPSSVTPTVSTQQNFTLYPNPATNILNITSSSGVISISDPLGRGYVVSWNGNALDISSLPSGAYFVSDGVSRAKFVKE